MHLRHVDLPILCFLNLQGNLNVFIILVYVFVIMNADVFWTLWRGLWSICWSAAFTGWKFQSWTTRAVQRERGASKDGSIQETYLSSRYHNQHRQKSAHSWASIRWPEMERGKPSCDKLALHTMRTFSGQSLAIWTGTLTEYCRMRSIGAVMEGCFQWIPQGPSYTWCLSQILRLAFMSWSCRDKPLSVLLKFNHPKDYNRL